MLGQLNCSNWMNVSMGSTASAKDKPCVSKLQNVSRSLEGGRGVGQAYILQPKELVAAIVS